MKISIAMTTYNGMKYIEELLDSIRTQTRRADEVVIVDDYSTDGTPEHIVEYIDRYALNGWRIIRNDSNLGWRLNFRKALRQCNNDLIFLCDQDDIWKKTKIEEMGRIMESNSEIELLVSDYEPLISGSDENVKIHNRDRNSKKVTKRKLKYGSLNVLRPGCTYCIRQSLVKCLETEDISDAPHDAIIWGYASIRESLYHYSRDTIVYRRHQGCASLSEEKLSTSKRVRQIQYDIGVESFFRDVCRKSKLYTAAEIIEKKLQFSKKRLDVINSQGIIPTVIFVVTHLNYYPTLRNALSDVWIIALNK